MSTCTPTQRLEARVSRRRPVADFYDAVMTRRFDAPLAMRGLAVQASFAGEAGHGPGVVREVLQLVATSLLTDPKGLFTPWPPPPLAQGGGDARGGGGGGGGGRDDVAGVGLGGGVAGGVWHHVNPGCMVAHLAAPWRFVGRFLGLCITTGSPVR